MRARFLPVPLAAALVALLAAAPVGAQVCSPEAAPDVATLFPDEVEGLRPEFYRTQTGCVTKLYRGGSPWATLSLEPNRQELGRTADGLADHYAALGMDAFRHQGWPVARGAADELGQLFTTLRGPVKISVLVKDGDGGPGSEALARAFLDALFLRIPCELGT